MTLPLATRLLWAAGFLTDAVLLFVLLYKFRYRTAPWFTAWITFGLLNNVTLYLGYRFGSRHLYAQLYWSGAFLDLLLQAAVVFEVARGVLRRGGRWVEGARVRLLFVTAIAPLLAFSTAWFMTPAADSRLDAWDARANLFISVLIVTLFSGVILASQQLAVRWRSHIMREGYGLTIWTLASFAADTLHSYWRTAAYFSALEYLRAAVFETVSLYWAVLFWFPESEPESVFAETIAHLHASKSRLR